MGSFPESVTPPPSYQEARLKRRRELGKSICIGLSVRLLIVIVEVVGYLIFRSYSLLFDGLASSIDVAFSLILLLGVKLAGKDPDKNHPFGHGRYEPLFGLLLSLFLVQAGAVLALQQYFTLTSNVMHDHPLTYAWIIPATAVVFLEVSYWVMISYAERHHSAALKADAVHFRIDALNSLLAAIALIFADLFHAYSGLLDHLGAFSIALLMLVMGVITGRENLHQVMDRRPEETYFDKVRRAARRVKGVLEVEKLNIQLFGPDAHVDIDIEVDPSMRVDDAHRITQEVRLEIQKNWPMVRDVIVHVEPYYENDHD